MYKAKMIPVVLVAIVVMAFGAACANGEANSTLPAALDVGQPGTQSAEPASPSTSGGVPPPTGTTAPTGAVNPVAPPAPATEPAPAPQVPNNPAVIVRDVGAPAGQVAAYQAGGSQSGIWVTGEGTISLEPDLVLVNIGVETTDETVAAARARAASAMAAIVDAVKAYGVDDRDIQTRSFNIWPEYEFPEVSEGGRRVRRQVLVGYRISNTATIKVRDLDAVGDIIDDVADAGGDATRINGISFTIDDPKPHMTQLRQDAVEDALNKAEQFASLTGVSVGPLVYISEGGATSPVVQDFARAEFGIATARAAPSTPISGGELELSLRVQTVFGIVQ